MMKRFGKSVLAAATAVGLGLGLSATASANDPIKIGSYLAVTGPASFLGEPELNTLQMYIEQINAEGGVLGRPLQLVHYDTSGDARSAVTFVTRLVEQDGVDFIVGGTTSGETLAVMEIAEESEVVHISLAGSRRIVDPVQTWTFKTPHTDTMACEKIFEHMQSQGLTTVGMISGTDGFGASMRNECLGVVEKYGITIVADETYAPGDNDMTAQLTRIRGVSGLQAVINPGFGQGPAIVTRNYAQLGISVPLYQSHGVASRSFIDLAGPAAEGVRLPAAALLVADLLPDDDAQKPVVVAYRDAYEGRFGAGTVSTFGGHAYDGLMLLVKAIEAAGSTDKAAVRSALETLSGFMGTAGEFNLSPEDHMGLDLSAFRMLEIRDGTWTLME